MNLEEDTLGVGDCQAEEVLSGLVAGRSPETAESYGHIGGFSETLSRLSIGFIKHVANHQSELGKKDFTNTVYNEGGVLLTLTSRVIRQWEKYVEDLLSHQHIFHGGSWIGDFVLLAWCHDLLMERFTADWEKDQHLQI